MSLPITSAAPFSPARVLDADVLSQPAKRKGDSKVIEWLRDERDRCYTSSIVIAQLGYWVRTREGRQPNERRFRRPGLGVFNPFKELS
jgi:predicted nucleic acid-binding protein